MKFAYASAMTVAIAAALASMTSSVAEAQTAVVVYGQLDAGIMYASKTANAAGVAGPSNTAFQNAQMSPGFYGIKGSEDLGDGLTAGFQLEGGVNIANGNHASQGTQTQIFGRAANVSLGGDWGTVAAGLVLDPGYAAAITTEPRMMSDSLSNLEYWALASAGNSLVFSGGLFDQSAVKYTYNKNGLYLGLEYGFGGVAGSTSANSIESLGLSYAVAGLTVSGSYSVDKNVNPAIDADSSEIGVVGVGYQFAPFAVRVQYGDYRVNPGKFGGNSDVQSWGIGFDWNTSDANRVNLAYYDAKDVGANFGGSTTELALMDSYRLSKRTSIYGQIASVDAGNKAGMSAGLAGPYYTPAGGAASGITTSFVGFGMVHRF